MLSEPHCGTKVDSARGKNLFWSKSLLKFANLIIKFANFESWRDFAWEKLKNSIKIWIFETFFNRFIGGTGGHLQVTGKVARFLRFYLLILKTEILWLHSGAHWGSNGSKWVEFLIYQHLNCILAILNIENSIITFFWNLSAK